MIVSVIVFVNSVAMCVFFVFIMCCVVCYLGVCYLFYVLDIACGLWALRCGCVLLLVPDLLGVL